MLCTRTEEGVSEADYVDILLDQHVSGVIFAGGLYAQADADHDHYRRLQERRLPSVLVNAAIEGIGFPIVSADDAVAVRQAYGHLRSLGHGRIGLVLGPGRRESSTRSGNSLDPQWTLSADCSPWKVARRPRVGCCGGA